MGKRKNKEMDNGGDKNTGPEKHPDQPPQNTDVVNEREKDQPATGDAAGNPQTKKQQVIRAVPRWLVITELAVGVVCTIIIAYFTYRLSDYSDKQWKTSDNQWQAMKEQSEFLRTQSEDMRRQSLDMAKQSELMAKQYEAMIAGMSDDRLLNRPWINFVPLKNVIVEDGEETIEFTFLTLNYGKIPAEISESRISYHLVDDLITFDFDDHLAEHNESKPVAKVGIVPPNQGLLIAPYPPIAIIPDDIRALKEEASMFFIIATIKYHDAQGTEGFTQQAWRFDVRTKTLGSVGQHEKVE